MVKEVLNVYIVLLFFKLFFVFFAVGIDGSHEPLTRVSSGTPYFVDYFYTIEEAFQTYKREKEKVVKERSTKYFHEGKITQRVYQALMEYQVEITD